MKLNKNPVLSVCITVGLAGGAMTLPAVSHAELSTELSLNTMNMFRGQSESNFAPAFDGEIDYEHSSGLYAGTEIVNSSEGGGEEWDLMYGYRVDAGPISLDLGMVHYLYPMATEDHDNDPTTEERRSSLSDSAETEYKIGVAFKDYSMAYYKNTDSDADYSYISLDYQGKLFGAHYGITNHSIDDPEGTGEKVSRDYNDVSLSYGLTERVTFTVSVAFGDAVGKSTEDVEGDPLVMLSYELPIGGEGE